MSISWYKPKTPFTGLVNSCQGFCSSILNISYSGVWSSDRYLPSNAFNYSSSFPAATSSGNDGNWIKFSLKNNKYFYITHYELRQRSSTNDSLLKSWVFQAYDKNNEIVTLDQQNASDEFFKINGEQLFTTKKGVFNSFELKEQQGFELVIQRIEIYGFLCDTYNECISILLKKTCSCHNYNIKPLLYLLIII